MELGSFIKHSIIGSYATLENSSYRLSYRIFPRLLRSPRFDERQEYDDQTGSQYAIVKSHT